MKKSLTLISILALMLPAMAQKAKMSNQTIEQILAKPATFDKKDVNVTGMVKNFKAKVSKKGNKYTSFEIVGKTAKSTINVYLPNHLDPKLGIKDGATVLVRGKYQVEKKVGETVFKNEILAFEKGKPYGVFPMKRTLSAGSIKVGG